MPLEIKKKEKESSQNLVRRFTRSIQQSGILFRARSLMFRKRKKSKRMMREAALQKIKKKEQNKND